MKPIFRSYLTEINLGTTLPGDGQAKQFQDYPVLRNVVLMGIAAVSADLLTRSPQNAPIVPTVLGLTLTMVDKYQAEVIKDFPVFDLVTLYQGGIYREFQPFELNLVKSYITVRNNAGLAANESVCFNLFYLPLDVYKKLFPVGQPRRSPVATAPRPR